MSNEITDNNMLHRFLDARLAIRAIASLCYSFWRCARHPLCSPAAVMLVTVLHRAALRLQNGALARPAYTPCYLSIAAAIYRALQPFGMGAAAPRTSSPCYCNVLWRTTALGPDAAVRPLPLCHYMYYYFKGTVDNVENKSYNLYHMIVLKNCISFKNKENVTCNKCNEVDVETIPIKSQPQSILRISRDFTTVALMPLWPPHGGLRK
ncbi:hypothetical protein DH2020_003985 [Rehmannia glutinosa]|uniref:Uncharacterized protein n=1 Tax=Rehmannia glutinosa TaxID=99300 RepID=A0ABR0XN79_REHGL